MKTIGIIGGIGPESTIDYYRSLVTEHRRRWPEAAPVSILINSINMKQMLGLTRDNRLAELIEFLTEQVRRLAAAGADFALLAANTPHIVFDDLARRSPIPMISIVEATCDQAKRLGIRRVGLLGTRFTMGARFYPDVFAREGLEVFVPGEDEQRYIDDKYFSELVLGNFLAETRRGLSDIVAGLKAQHQVQGVILGGTELPLILRSETMAGVALLDTTQIHVCAALDRLGQ